MRGTRLHILCVRDVVGSQEQARASPEEPSATRFWENAAMSRKFLTVVLASCLSTCFSADDAIGQSLYGEISGRFTDVLRNPIAGAEVTVTSREKGNRFRTRTNEFGNFQIPGLVPDTYSIAVEVNGFKTFRETEIPVFADQASRVNASLPRGESTDFVVAIQVT